MAYLYQLTLEQAVKHVNDGKDVESLAGHLITPHNVVNKWADEVTAVKVGKHGPIVVPERVAQSVRLYDMAGLVNGKIIMIEDAVLVTPEPPKLFTPPNFSWSYTALNDFETCPLSFAEKRYFKRVKVTESEEMRWGKEVHKAYEDYAKGLPIPAAERKIPELGYKVVDSLRRFGGTLMAEQQIAINRQFKPTEWFGKDAWGRGIVDAAAMNDDKVLICDYKTGKKKHDETQLRIFCLFFALMYPHLQEFDAKFAWLKEPNPKDAITGLQKPLRRADLKPVLEEVITRVARMEAAWDAAVFQARTSGLCKRWCDVMTCVHNGKRGK